MTAKGVLHENPAFEGLHFDPEVWGYMGSPNHQWDEREGALKEPCRKNLMSLPHSPIPRNEVNDRGPEKGEADLVIKKPAAEKKRDRCQPGKTRMCRKPPS